MVDGLEVCTLHPPCFDQLPEVEVGIVGDSPDCTDAPQGLSSHELDSVGMLQSQGRSQGSLKSFSRCLPEPSQGVQPCFPVIGVVVEIEHVHGLLPLGQLLPLQELCPPGPVSVVEKSRINPLPNVPERTFGVKYPPSYALLARTS